MTNTSRQREPPRRVQRRSSAIAHPTESAPLSPYDLLRWRQRLFEPLVDGGYDLLAVLLLHHVVAVSLDAEVGELEPRRFYSSLLQEFHGAMVVGRIIGRFRRHYRDRNLLQVRKLACWFGLLPAGDEVGGSPRQNYLCLSAELTRPCLFEAILTSNHAPQRQDEAPTREKPTYANLRGYDELIRSA
jgi:hypothetical protein